MLLALVLVCSLSTSADDCTRETALDVVARPVAMPTECALVAQALAASALDVNRADGRYLKIRCEHRKS